MRDSKLRNKGGLAHAEKEDSQEHRMRARGTKERGRHQAEEETLCLQL